MSETELSAGAKLLRIVSCVIVFLGLVGCGPAQEKASDNNVASPNPSREEVARDLGQCSTYFGAPSSDSQRAALWDGRQDSQPLCLFVAAAAWADFDKQKAADLFALGMVRYRYDALRCTNGISGPVSSFLAAGRMAAGDRLADLGIMVGRDQIGPVAMDASSYIYPVYHLQALCDGQVRPAADWPEVQNEMQASVTARTNS